MAFSACLDDRWVRICAWTSWLPWSSSYDFLGPRCNPPDKVDCRFKDNHNANCFGNEAFYCTENCEEYELKLYCCETICPTSVPSTTSEGPTTTEGIFDFLICNFSVQYHRYSFSHCLLDTVLKRPFTRHLCESRKESKRIVKV